MATTTATTTSMASTANSNTISWRSSPAFILVVVGFAICSDMFLFACLTPVLPFVLRSRINVPEQKIQSAISYSLTAFFVTSIVTPCFVAFYGRHKWLRRPLYLLSLALLTIATVMLYFVRRFPLFVAIRVMQGTSGSIVWVVGMGMVRDTVEAEGLGKATGTIFGLATVGAVGAPAIGGALYRARGLGGLTLLSLAILVVDFVLRLLVLEHDTNDKHATLQNSDPDIESTAVQGHDGNHPHVDERTTLFANAPNTTELAVEYGSRGLLPKKDNDLTAVHKSASWIFAKAPILRTLLHPAMWVSIAICTLQAMFISFVDSIIPLRLGQTIDFDALQCGLMLLTISGTTVLVAPIAGIFVDRHGPKPLAVLGTLVVALGVTLLGLPLPEDRVACIIAFAVYLCVLGVGLATLDSPAFVASALLVEQLHQSEPHLFGPDPPYVEHQAVVYTFYSLGMVMGPLVSAGLSRIMSFWAMSAVFAGASLLLGLASVVYL